MSRPGVRRVVDRALPQRDRIMPHAILRDRARAEGDDNQCRQHCRELSTSSREAHDQNRQQITETNRRQIQVAVLHDVFEVKHAQVKHRQQRRDHQSQRRPQLAAYLFSVDPQSNRQSYDYRHGQEKPRIAGAGQSIVAISGPVKTKSECPLLSKVQVSAFGM